MGRKKKIEWEENKMADILVLLGAYDQYKKIEKPETEFEQFYLSTKERRKYEFRSKANRMINEKLLDKGIHLYNRTTKKFYRRNVRCGVKPNGKLGYYFVCVMDSVMEDRVLTEIMFRHIFDNCINYTKNFRNEKGYNDCYLAILGFQFDRIQLENEKYKPTKIYISNKIKKAHKSYVVITSYSKIDIFREGCRNKSPIVSSI